MTGNPLYDRSTAFNEFLEKLAVEEQDNSVLKEKVEFMSNVAVDRLHTQAEGHIISLKGPALLALAAHKDQRCVELLSLGSTPCLVPLFWQVYCSRAIRFRFHLRCQLQLRLASPNSPPNPRTPRNRWSISTGSWTGLNSSTTI